MPSTSNASSHGPLPGPPDRGALPAAKSAPHNWLAGLKRIPLHALFSAVGVGARFLPPPWNFAALGGFAAWRAIAELGDYRGKRDTGAKAAIDFASQVGSAAAGAFVP